MNMDMDMITDVAQELKHTLVSSSQIHITVTKNNSKVIKSLFMQTN